MKKFVVLSCLLALCMTACQKQQKQEYAGVEGDYVNGTPLPPRQEGVSFLSNNVAKGQLQQIGSFIKSGQNNVILAGFTDERGTPEYNRGLGERRAQAARSYLLSLGVSPARIQTVSFGQEMPADPGPTESAWAKNRRAETGVVR